MHADSPEPEVAPSDWPAPPGREAEAAVFARHLARAASGLPTFLLIEHAHDEDVATALTTIAEPARDFARLIELDAPADAPYDPLGQAAASLARGWRARVRRARLGESGSRLLPEWLGTIPVVGNLVAAILVTGARVVRKAPRPSLVGAPNVTELVRAAQRRPLVLLAHRLERAGPAAATALCRLVHEAPVGTRLFLAGSVETGWRGDAAPIVMLAQGLGARAVLHRLVPATSAAIDGLGALDPAAVEALEAAAVIGETFDGNTVARLLERDELEIEDRLAHALRARIVENAGLRDLEDGDIATVYRFASGALRAVLVQRAGERRAPLEQRLADLRNRLT